MQQQLNIRLTKMNGIYRKKDNGQIDLAYWVEIMKERIFWTSVLLINNIIIP